MPQRKKGLENLTPDAIMELLNKGRKSPLHRWLICRKYGITSEEWHKLDREAQEAIHQHFVGALTPPEPISPEQMLPEVPPSPSTLLKKRSRKEAIQIVITSGNIPDQQQGTKIISTQPPTETHLPITTTSYPSEQPQPLSVRGKWSGEPIVFMLKTQAPHPAKQPQPLSVSVVWSGGPMVFTLETQAPHPAERPQPSLSVRFVERSGEQPTAECQLMTAATAELSLTALKALLLAVAGDRPLRMLLDSVRSYADSLFSLSANLAKLGQVKLSVRDLLVIIEASEKVVQAIAKLAKQAGLSESQVTEILDTLARMSAGEKTGLPISTCIWFMHEVIPREEQEVPPINMRTILGPIKLLDCAWTALIGFARAYGIISSLAREALLMDLAVRLHEAPLQLLKAHPRERQAVVREHAEPISHLADQDYIEYVKEEMAREVEEPEPEAQLPSDSILDAIRLILAKYELGTVVEVMKRLIEVGGDLTWDDALDIINARTRCHKFVNEDEFTGDIRPHVWVQGPFIVYYSQDVIPLDNEFRETFERSTLLRKLQIIQEFIAFGRDYWVQTLSIPLKRYKALAKQAREELRQRILTEKHA